MQMQQSNSLGGGGKILQVVAENRSWHGSLEKVHVAARAGPAELEGRMGTIWKTKYQRW